VRLWLQLLYEQSKYDKALKELEIAELCFRGTKSSEALVTTHDLSASVKATLRIERESRNEGAFQRTTLEQARPHIAGPRREWRGRCRPKVHSRLGLSGVDLKQKRGRGRDYSD
jgi:hypothetical protein